MAAGTWTFTNHSKENLATGVYDFDSTTTFYCALLTSAASLSATSTTWASVSANEPSDSTYTAGGIQLAALAETGTSTRTVGDPTTTVSWTITDADEIIEYAVVRHTTSGDIVAYVEVESGSTLTVVAGNDIAVSVTTLWTLT